MTYDHVITEATTRRVVDLLDDLDVTDPEYAHVVVDELLLDLDAWTGQGNHSRESAAGNRIERLWSNRPLGESLSLDFGEGA